MRTNTNTTKTISRNILKEKLLIKDDRTIELYIAEGALPKPIKELENEELLFEKEEVLRLLGAKSIEEEFINSEEVSRMLNVTVSSVQSFARKGLIPSYRLKNVKGSQILYLPSEIEAAKQYTIQWQTSFANNLIIKEATNAIFSKLLDKNQSLLTEREIDVLRLALLENKKPEEIAKKFDLTKTRIQQIFQKGIRRLSMKLENIGARLNSSSEWNQKVSTLTQKVNELTQIINDLQDEKDRKLRLPEETQQILSASLSDFDIPARALNILHAADILTVENLARMSRKDFLLFRNAGKKSADELEDFLASKGLTWNMNI